MGITQELVARASGEWTIVPEVTPAPVGFSMFNDAGTEVEVSEFIYALVRMCKPKFVLETGTHRGISSTYIGEALKENNQSGKIVTLEIIDQHYAYSTAFHKQMGLDSIVTVIKMPSLLYTPTQPIDFLFLDSEPQLRFDELVRFLPCVVEGGIILIHDLHPSMGHHGQVYHDVYDWPYGDFRPKLGQYMKDLDITWMHFPTPRGLTMFQKRSSSFLSTKHVKDEPI